jgi:hypothetical protein
MVHDTIFSNHKKTNELVVLEEAYFCSVASIIFFRTAYRLSWYPVQHVFTTSCYKLPSPVFRKEWLPNLVIMI